ncbi:MAG TPA: NAD(P)/FAD-dependent oxidoreductase [Intrasporangium sp.]|uniref:flavin-containing monooxygenase n=1 Tax=Intrasporangium sp. TaxID=1925024 RepID=UPI002D778C20|nr:NAD(P)/FAD-dependent oxidoreductase [Intrasporangium sp.]HET7398833.1 NAD(P)/FAD-dependent oxidoreductase [Intrasporangium sp.]
MSEHLDVLVIGAGLSGIGAGYHLMTTCPDRSWAILEARDAIGGTWDLFRYPGLRSDSDMSTLGFPFDPWTDADTLADGAKILGYIRRVARSHGVDRRIRYEHKVIGASWSSDDARWTVTVEVGPAARRQTMTCGFLYLCTGYYDYDTPHRPELPGQADFRGRLVHPQFWPEDLDVAGKRVVVIGSGATAVTLVPALAERGARVTMLQRSPTWVVSLPRRDPVSAVAHRVLPTRAAAGLVRTKNVLLSLGFYQLTRRGPSVARSLLSRAATRELGADVVREHFTPVYDPWDQRLCAVPDGDLYAALRDGRADVVTDTIDRVTPTGIRLTSGCELEADVIVTATGLRMSIAGGIDLVVDDERPAMGELFVYRGALLGGVPNLAISVGYVNLAWSLRADLTARYVCRLLNTMRAHGWRVATPVPREDLEPRPLLPLASGYVTRAAGSLPRQGDSAPWVMRQNYLRDRREMARADVTEDMSFR